MNRTKAALALLKELQNHPALDADRNVWTAIDRVLQMPETESEAAAREVDDLLEEMAGARRTSPLGRVHP